MNPTRSVLHHVKLSFDGSVRPHPGGRGGWGFTWTTLSSPRSTPPLPPMATSFQLSGAVVPTRTPPTTNQIAESTGLIHGLRALLRHTPDPRTLTLTVAGDSLNVIAGVRGDWRIRVGRQTHRYCAVAKGLVGRFGGTRFEEVGRKMNKEADALAVRGTFMTVGEDQLAAFRPCGEGMVKVWCGGTRVAASFDGDAGARSMVDAQFLADEMGGGVEVLGALKDPHPIVGVRTWRGGVERGPVAVLGVVPEMEVGAWRVREVLVVEGLPVPVHVAGEEGVRALREEGVVPFGRESLPLRFGAHAYWDGDVDAVPVEQ
ncbi:hypothetical protein HDU96_010933 [Phlyctochytrium bullatum]|nr:hypothetical protein HDU96_010933 [Phlyctochytrium bullatum]